VAAAVVTHKMIREETKEAMVGATKAAAMARAVRMEENIKAGEDRKELTVKISPVEATRPEGMVKMEAIKEEVMVRVEAIKEEAMGKAEVSVVRNMKAVDDMRRVGMAEGTKAAEIKVEATDKTKVDTEVETNLEATAADAMTATTMPAMPFVTVSSMAATATRRAACSARPCHSSARISRASRTKMLTKTKWCRLTRNSMTRAEEISSMIPTLLVPAQPCRH
jgi:hypothetical protein